MSTFDDALAAITDIAGADAASQAAMRHASQVRAAAASTGATLRDAIAQRVPSLRDAAAAAGTFATNERTRATAVGGFPIAQVTPTAIQAELALLHTDLAAVADNQVLMLTALADLATVVGDRLVAPPTLVLGGVV